MDVHEILFQESQYGAPVSSIYCDCWEKGSGTTALHLYFAKLCKDERQSFCLPEADGNRGEQLRQHGYIAY